jgi:hypothetical protein
MMCQVGTQAPWSCATRLRHSRLRGRFGSSKCRTAATENLASGVVPAPVRDTMSVAAITSRNPAGGASTIEAARQRMVRQTPIHIQESVLQSSKCLAAAAVGGVLGYYGFFWARSFGFYAMVLPGGMIGIGASVFPVRRIWVPIVCAAAAVALSLFTEWKHAPFRADPSFGYFVTHVQDLSGFTLFLMAIGTILAFYLPFRHRNDPGAL